MVTSLFLWLPVCSYGRHSTPTHTHTHTVTEHFIPSECFPWLETAAGEWKYSDALEIFRYCLAGTRCKLTTSSWSVSCEHGGKEAFIHTNHIVLVLDIAYMDQDLIGHATAGTRSRSTSTRSSHCQWLLLPGPRLSSQSPGSQVSLLSQQPADEAMLSMAMPKGICHPAAFLVSACCRAEQSRPVCPDMITASC